MHPPQPPQDATDIFSITDEVLAERLQFIEEIGFGNWGSVWLCRPRPDPTSSTDLPDTDAKIAVKLVHRSKTPTTAARVRSLWNEMKVVRSFKHEPHPSIIPFYSFIITPSYAMITMAYHRKLVPVEVAEHHAKEWFHSLLSGIEFLHKRGVVHNDIKPANILLSSDNVPVLVDFGFAERYDLDVSTAFHSNLSYGTPEYLSPERARGLQHDTRKSDVWSLGITFFEILIGRTPFEHGSGEQFSTKEDLEKYWARTMKGKWVGSWKMSKHVEKLLKRMIAPNADVRCTASDAMADVYWTMDAAPHRSHAHKKSASVSQVLSPSLTANLNTDVSKLLDTIPPWTSRSGKEQIPDISPEAPAPAPAEHKAHKRTKSKIPVLVDKENGLPAALAGPPGLSKTMKEKEEKKSKHARSQSQPKLLLDDNKVKGATQSRKGLILPSLLSTLSPIKHTAPLPPPDISASFSLSPQSSNIFTSPTTTSTTQVDENSTPATSPSSFHKRTTSNVRPARKPMGPRQTPPRTPHQTLTSREKSDIVAFLNFSSVSNPDVSYLMEKDKSDTVRSRDSARSRTDREREKDKENSKDSISKRRRSNIFSDFTSTAKNVDLSAHTLPPISSKEKPYKERSARLREVNLPSPSAGKENTPSPQVFVPPSKNITSEEKKGSVRDRMREWERDRERLREMQRVEERLREAEEERNDLEREEAERLQAEIEEQQILQAQEASKREEEERRQREEEEFLREVELAKEREAERIRASVSERPSGIPRLAVQVPATSVEEFSSSSGPSTPGPDMGYMGPTALSPVLEVTEVSDSFEQRFIDSYTRSNNDNSMSILKQSLTNALDKTFRLYKSSTLGFSRSNQALDVSGSVEPEGDSRLSVSFSGKGSSQWDDEAARESKSSLPIVRQAAKTEQVAAENQLDRMTLWIKSVEKVVEDARQSFAASAPAPTLPPLPVAPSRPHSRAMDRTLNSSVDRSLRPNRLPRRILAANQIFVNEYESGEVSPSFTSEFFNSAPPSAAHNGSFGLEHTLPTIPSEPNSPAPVMRELPSTPNKTRTRTRSHTVVTRSPEVKKERPSLEIDTTASPSKRREKSRSQNDLSRAITPVAELELQIEKMAAGLTTPKLRLSEIVDKNVFVSKSTTNLGITQTPERKRKLDELTASPLHVEPYPPRPQSTNPGPPMDTPARKHVEGVYDRFLMSTTGVKRAGKGYQSDNGGPVGHIASPKPVTQRKKENFFSTRRKPLLPPVSSEDWRKSAVDEFGAICSSKDEALPHGKAEQGHGPSIVRRALRTIVNGKR